VVQQHFAVNLQRCNIAVKDCCNVYAIFVCYMGTCFEQYIRFVHTQTENVIKTIMSDNGTEYTDQAFVEIAKKNGIKIGRSAVYTPQQNGRAEKENRTLIEMARTMLLTHGMSRRFWAEALNCAAYILNIQENKERKEKRLMKLGINGNIPYIT